MKNVNPMRGKCKYRNVVRTKVLQKCGEPTSVIELGCGMGMNLAQFKRAKKRVGIDPHKPNVEAAKQKSEGAKIIEGTHENLKDFGVNEFDVGITCSVIDHIGDGRDAVNEMMKVCKKINLIEPMIEGEDRQTTPEESSEWHTTWYHNYREFLTEKGVEFDIEPLPLYVKNDGQKYHLIHIECENYKG